MGAVDALLYPSSDSFGPNALSSWRPILALVTDYRCASTHGAKRCQLLVHKPPEVPHAHFDRQTMICTRWDESGSWLEPRGPFGDVTAERLPWHSMGSPI
jgi:hypothetical protein